MPRRPDLRPGPYLRLARQSPGLPRGTRRVGRRTGLPRLPPGPRPTPRPPGRRLLGPRPARRPAPLGPGRSRRRPPAAPLGSVVARDCSTITLPAELADRLPGCGHGRPRQASAGLKLHVGLELTTGALEGVGLNPAKTADRSCAGSHAPLPEGALLLEDLGFFDVPRLRHYAEQGCYVLSRAPARLLITAPGRRPQNIDRFLAGLAGERFDRWVTIGRRHKTWRCRLIAVRVPPAVAQQRRERVEQEAP